MFRMGIDIGGTFTDIVLRDDETGGVHIWKTLTTPEDPVQGAVAGVDEVLEAANVESSLVSTAIHGTTLVANLLIERKGAKTALLTTRGFRDLLAIGRERRFDMYDLFLEMPKPLIPRALRREVSERIDEKGEIVVPLDEGEVGRALAEFRKEGIESLAVCFLHAYRNPLHERAVGRIGESEPELFVSLSSDVLPEIREFERVSTTAANAYARPVLKNYLSRLGEEIRIRGVRNPMAVMLSSGGITSVNTAEKYPIRVVESGPAAGAFGAAQIARSLEWDKTLSFDMGGTAAKLCLIGDGEPLRTNEFEVARTYRHKKGSGLPIRIPVIDLVEVGAGGGSIARTDSMGLLKVGPDSAGADPGPACYGRGGIEPTVTDADLVLGYLNPDFFLGGRLHLFPDKAQRAINEWVARPLGLTTEEAAWGIHQIVNEHMAGAARLHGTERGWTLNGLTMIAFGGAGPVHAHGLARSLGLARVAFPASSGVLSALGFLVAPPAFDLVRTYPIRLTEFDEAAIRALLEEMTEEAIRTLWPARELFQRPRPSGTRPTCAMSVRAMRSP